VEKVAREEEGMELKNTGEEYKFAVFDQHLEISLKWYILWHNNRN